ncbi:efflux RND transporter periplasmic adaptor subunit [Marinicella gelatinilytica]|uniref:efflux RND transporter periplasmic adaptor subunit n=1 Tax=Marinicella gelatinilytica TaxID=2996017 RepID=UPI002260B362|nr:efflux RND transporter periplasmic adaptor subunit [Marinicella gelatinilytica]MCX7545825.1 efflux RND transporter periplasmic adaptor subunit [Marinicella gelatinilytica]
MKNIALIFITLLITGCDTQPKETSQIPTLVLQKQPVELIVRAAGELEATQSTPLTVPAGSRRPQTLAWILPQFSEVKKGDVVARFDGTDFQLELDETAYELEKLRYAMLDKEREIDNTQFSFNTESQVVDYEYELAKQFNINDPLLYTKIEIIEAGDNEEFLKAKTQHIEKVSENFEEKSATELGVLESSKAVQEAKKEVNQASLSALEVVAPHDGLLVLQASWDGTMPEPGKAVFPGTKLGALPDLSKMQALVYVPEIEAIGIKPEQPVKLSLDAYPNETFTGVVESLSQTAQPRERDNPVKYFTITVALDGHDERFRPAQRLAADIKVATADHAIAVPILAISRDQDKSWVQVQRGNKFERQQITTRFCSAALCIIESGLNDGDVIALTEPTQEVAL